MRELVEEVWLPQCLTIGISYELFPSLNPKKIEPFKKAFSQKKDEERAVMNMSAWLSGLYVRDAIVSALSKNVLYPEKPFELNGDKNINHADRFRAWAQMFNHAHPELK